MATPSGQAEELMFYGSIEETNGDDVPLMWYTGDKEDRIVR